MKYGKLECKAKSLRSAVAVLLAMTLKAQWKNKILNSQRKEKSIVISESFLTLINMISVLFLSFRIILRIFTVCLQQLETNL